MNISEQDFNGKDLKMPFTGFVLFSADWCGYCKQLKPVWAEISDKVGTAMVDCTSGNKDIVKFMEIQGFPSIHIYKEGNYMGEYNGDRTAEGLMSYAQRNLPPKTDVAKPMNLEKKSNIFLYLLFIGAIIAICAALFC